MKKENFFNRFPLILTLPALVVWMSVAAVGFFGCGKKGPPLPPHSGLVPPVADLSHDLKNSQVLLTWTIPDKVKQGLYGEGKMILFRAKTKLTDNLCSDCPPAFERVAALQILRADGEQKPGYEEEVRPGFRYTYKVVLQMDSGRSSELSNQVEFDYQGPER